jgi:TonB family protein
MRRLFLFFVLVVSFGSPAAVGQTADANPVDAPEAEIGTVFAPMYPPLARQARIMGDVKIDLGIRTDGKVESAEVVSGHAMLKQAALDSARKSTYFCLGCTRPVTPLAVTYTFATRDDHDGFNLCGFRRRARSAKCLYLWKCSEWQAPLPGRNPAYGQTRDRVLVLADAACVETETAR